MNIQMNVVFKEAEIGSELYYYWIPSFQHNKIYRKVIKISDTEYKELEGPEIGKTKQLSKFPIICTWSKDKPASGGKKRTNRRIKKNNKSRKGKSIKNRRK